MQKQEFVYHLYNELKKKGRIKTKTFKKNEIVTNFLVNRNYLYFILDGSCSLYRYTRDGEMHFLQRYDRFDCFGDIFHNIELNSEQSVVANNKTTVFYFDYDEIIENTEFNDLYIDLCNIMIIQMRIQNDRIEVLAKKTIRNRLLTYFDILSKRSTVLEFEIPMSISKLSSFLGVDRSAMTRELKTLEEDNIIIRKHNKIKLIKH